MRYALHDLAEPRLREELAARGVHPSRLEFTPMAPWLDHVWRKTHLDVMLDSIVKVGSFGDAGRWAQVPSISLAGNSMEARAAHGVASRAPISVHGGVVSEGLRGSRLHWRCETVGSRALLTQEAPNGRAALR